MRKEKVARKGVFFEAVLGKNKTEIRNKEVFLFLVYCDAWLPFEFNAVKAGWRPVFSHSCARLLRRGRRELSATWFGYGKTSGLSRKSGGLFVVSCRLFAESCLLSFPSSLHASRIAVLLARCTRSSTRTQSISDYFLHLSPSFVSC